MQASQIIIPSNQQMKTKTYQINKSIKEAGRDIWSATALLPLYLTPSGPEMIGRNFSVSPNSGHFEAWET